MGCADHLGARRARHAEKKVLSQFRRAALALAKVATVVTLLDAVLPGSSFAVLRSGRLGLSRRSFASQGARGLRPDSGPVSRWAEAKAKEAPKKLEFKSRYFLDTIRNVALISTMAGVVAASWYFTGKWWKLPLVFALPSMLYRLWVTRGDTEQLAAMSASVDKKYVASSPQAQKELHMFMCGECGYTLFPARGREASFFPDNFKCPMCQAPKSAFFDMNDAAEESTDKASASSTPSTSEAAKASTKAPAAPEKPKAGPSGKDSKPDSGKSA